MHGKNLRNARSKLVILLCLIFDYFWEKSVWFLTRSQCSAWRHIGCMHKLSNMADNTAKRRGGRYCVSGAPNNISCKNTTFTPGVKMHQFPSDPIVRRKCLSSDTKKTSTSHWANIHRCAQHILKNLATNENIRVLW